MNLQGLRVLNTRPITQGKSLSAAINAAGGIAIDCPALVIEPTHNNWLAKLPSLNTVEKAIFTSANAVDYCFNALAQAWPTSIQIITVGQATARALNKHNIVADCVPKTADSEHLLELDSLQSVKNKLILLFKGEKGRTLIAETLKAKGAHLFIFEVYKSVLPQSNKEQLHSLWHNEAVDIILFTSQQAMHNIFRLFGEDKHAWLRRIPCLVISERLAKEAELLGMQTIIVGSPETILTVLHKFNQGLIHGQ